MTAQPLWLRCEKKEFERRSALSPKVAQKLIEAGFKIFVERDEQRIFADGEFEKVGCTLVENNSWSLAPLSIPIIGLKELEVSDLPLPHTHIQFAHCYKNQAGWSEVLARFIKGKGTLYDLEFLTDEKGRRVAAFGYHAGFAGAAAGTLAYAAKKNGSQLAKLVPYDNEDKLIQHARESLGELVTGLKVMIMGALGRCGTGAVDFCRKIGLHEDNIIKWDMAETASGGPFPEILDADIFVNCIYLNSTIPPFLTKGLLVNRENYRLSVVVDVSCDTTNPFNPIPIYDSITTFDKPILEVEIGKGEERISVIAIDHLPTLLPREASEQFSADLLPSLLQLPNRSNARVWKEAEMLFEKKKDAAIADLKLLL